MFFLTSAVLLYLLICSNFTTFTLAQFTVNVHILVRYCSLSSSLLSLTLETDFFYLHFAWFCSMCWIKAGILNFCPIRCGSWLHLVCSCWIGILVDLYLNSVRWYRRTRVHSRGQNTGRLPWEWKKREEREELSTKGKPNRMLSANQNHKNLKVWHGISNTLKESGMRSLMCLMCLDLRIVTPWCATT